MKVKLPADIAIDPEVDLGMTNGGYLLQARLNVILPGIEREVAQKLVDGAHQDCPYSKATRGNINVVINVKTENRSPGWGDRTRKEEREGEGRMESHTP